MECLILGSYISFDPLVGGSGHYVKIMLYGILALLLVSVIYQIRALEISINYQRNEVFVLGVDEEEQNRVADLFNYSVGTFPMKYLGVMLSSNTCVCQT